MKYSIYVLVFSLLFSCTYNDLPRPVCYIQSEYLNGTLHVYGYNERNQLVADSYPGNNAAMSYDANGHIISESDYPDIQITYTYNDKSQLTQMQGISASYPSAYNWETKYNYNSNGQLVRLETWFYDGANSSYYLAHYENFEYVTSGDKNYSVRKGFNAADNLVWTEEFQWDSHPNPHLTNPYFANEPPPANNITAVRYTPTGGTTYVTNYTYVYNGKGFPVNQMLNGHIVNTYVYTNCN